MVPNTLTSGASHSQVIAVAFVGEQSPKMKAEMGFLATTALIWGVHTALTRSEVQSPTGTPRPGTALPTAQGLIDP